MKRFCLYFSFLIFVSCSGIRTLPEGQKLYTGAEIEWKSSEKIKDLNRVKERLQDAIRPRPNKKFLGNRPKVWIYNISNDSSSKGFRHWVREKLGEAPVLWSSVRPEASRELMDAALFNAGVFNGHTESRAEEKEKTARLVYTVYLHAPYTVSNFEIAGDTTEILRVIREAGPKSLIRPGLPYDLEILRQERKRIDEALKNEGFYYFNADYILFKADTSVTEKSVALMLMLKDSIPSSATRRYRIRGITIENDYRLSNPDSAPGDSLLYRGILFTGPVSIRPKVILRSVFHREGELYSRKNHTLTVSRLMGMGTFKYVRINYTPDEHDGLHATIRLTPAPRKSIQAELQTISKSNNFLGPALNLTYQNRNSLHGAELLKVNLKGSLETQLTGKDKNLFSFEVGPQVELSVPRFLTPFRIRQKESMYIPRTRFTAGFDYLQRVGYYDLTSFKFQFGYIWKENIKIDHELNPVSVNYFSARNKSEAFNLILSENPFFRRSFENQFIAGLNYSFLFNEQVIQNQRSQFYLHTTIDLSGNTISAYYKLIQNREPDPQSPLEVAGTPYSQFIRFTLDVRNYFNLSARDKLVLRLYSGIGYSYGNSSNLPYVKQFFSGGPSSVRAFRINSLGPGPTPSDSIDDPVLRNGGDLKLEANAEYRFDIYKLVKGALFIDAGNMWIREKDSTIFYSGFEISRFASQLAAGAGVGLRFDASFFVLRFDLAFPIRKPWDTDTGGWVYKQMRLSSPGWRKENLILNIAIGYPF